MDTAVCNDENCPGFVADGFEYGADSSGDVVNALAAWRCLAMPGFSPFIVCWPHFFSKVRFKTAFIVPQVDFQQCLISFNRVSRAIENDSSGFLCAIKWRTDNTAESEVALAEFTLHRACLAIAGVIERSICSRLPAPLEIPVGLAMAG